MGTNNMDEAIILRSQLNVLLERVGFLLRKWHTNSKDLLATIAEELKEKEPVTELKFPGDCLKLLVFTGTLTRTHSMCPSKHTAVW